MTKAHLAIVGALAITASLAVAQRGGVPNVAPASFSDVLRSATGRTVTVSTDREVQQGTLLSVNNDYLTVTTPEQVEIQIPFTSISHTRREGRTGPVGIVLR